MSEPAIPADASLARTPLTAWHEKAGARMTGFAGWSMPIQYSSLVAEHTATRTAAGLFDISHMGRLRFDGAAADRLLDRLLTRRVTDMEIGQVRYSLMCNEDGGVLDDVLVSCLEATNGQTYFLLVVNAANHGKISQWIGRHLRPDDKVTCRDVTEQTAMVAIQGPQAVDIVDRIYPQTNVQAIGRYRARLADQMKKPTILSRTGYTGEDGFEIIARREDAVRLWENLLLAGRDVGAIPVGLGARDTLRLEAGMPLYGHELSETVDPLSAGLQFAINLKDRQFIGRDAIERIGEMGPQVERIGLRFDGRRAAREGAKLLDFDGRTIGEVTSGTFSPTLGSPIAMAYVARGSVTPGAAVTADVRGSKIGGRVVELPFYRRNTNAHGKRP